VAGQKIISGVVYSIQDSPSPNHSMIYADIL
jgi:hypothetical protein